MSRHGRLLLGDGSTWPVQIGECDRPAVRRTKRQPARAQHLAFAREPQTHGLAASDELPGSLVDAEYEQHVDVAAGRVRRSALAADNEPGALELAEQSRDVSFAPRKPVGGENPPGCGTEFFAGRGARTVFVSRTSEGEYCGIRAPNGQLEQIEPRSKVRVRENASVLNAVVEMQFCTANDKLG